MGTVSNENPPDLDVELTRAEVGGVDRARVTLTSVAEDPVSIARICMQLDDGTCSADERQILDQSGRFKLCSDDSVNFDDCLPPNFPDSLPYGEQTHFRVFFRPIVAEDTDRMATILIESNAKDHPEARVFVRGILCDGNECGGKTPTCGNGERDGAEECDDGNQIDGDGCSSACVTEPQDTEPQEAVACGNGIREDDEECDDGNQSNGDGCDANCTLTGCGNGIVTMGETCDDGNQVTDDGCDNDCQLPAEAGCGPRLPN